MASTAWAGDFWRDRPVLITGHTGFKGAWLALWLQSLGARVSGLALEPPTRPSLFERADVAAGMAHRLGDIRDRGAVAATLATERPQVVLHLAAQSLVRESYQDPLATFEINVIGTANVLEAARLHNLSTDAPDRIRAIVVVTSDKCYENHEQLQGYRETDPLGGFDPYSASKGCAEIVTASLRRSFAQVDGAPAIASARAGNVIGGGDWAKDRLVPDAFNAFEAGAPLVIRNPHAIRPWQHVLEPLAGYLMLAERLCERGDEFAEAWNFGPDPDSEKTVGEVSDKLVGYWRGGAQWRSDSTPQPHEAGFLKLDSSKARARLGWRPRLSLDEALRMSVDWRRAAAAASPAALRDLTLAQIDDYCRGSSHALPETHTSTRTAAPGVLLS